MSNFMPIYLSLGGILKILEKFKLPRKKLKT